MKIIKYFLLLLISIIFITFVAFKNPGLDLFKASKDDHIILSDPAKLKNHVESIINTATPRNYLSLKSLNIVADNIFEVFKKNCDEVAFHPYKVKDVEYKNIRCSFNPQLKRRIIIGAHYDVYGQGPGADDNASGVAGILELSRLFKEKGIKTKKRIDLIAFTLEEPPFFRSKQMGSYIYAKELFDKKVEIELMLSLEMIGFYSDEPDSQKYFLPGMSFLFGDKGNYAALVGSYQEFSLTRKLRKALNTYSSIEIKSINAPRFIYGVDWSDHINFWKFNYPAFMITDTAFFRHSNYHRKTDSVDKLDFHSMAELISAIYKGISNF